MEGLRDLLSADQKLYPMKFLRNIWLAPSFNLICAVSDIYKYKFTNERTYSNYIISCKKAWNPAKPQNWQNCTF